MPRLDTLAQRWAALEPHLVRHGTPGTGPLVLLFHGCGGLRPHLPRYAQAAAAAGCEAVIVDSYAPRGWSHAYALAFVCTGAVLHGRQRAGDVLAAAWGLTEGGRNERPLVLAGWSHGAWSIMDLMTMALERPGEAGLADPSPDPLRTLAALFLAYPYGGVGALSQLRSWKRSPAVLGIVPARDHITSRRTARRLYGAARRAGAAVDLWENSGTHAFDEPTGVFPMRYDPILTDEALSRFSGLLATLDRAVSVASPPPVV